MQLIADVSASQPRRRFVRSVTGTPSWKRAEYVIAQQHRTTAMCRYCERTSDFEIIGDIAAETVPDDVLQCHHGWAETARVYATHCAGRDGDDVASWVELRQRRARALARLAVATRRDGPGHGARA
jgi:hypothetical protein